MKRIAMAVILSTMVCVGGVAIAASSATVKLEKTPAGQILVNGADHTIYMFTADSKNKSVCAKTGGCLSIWPALTTKDKPIAGPGVNRKLLGTIKLGNTQQVTYDGHPLYLYSYDTARVYSYIGVNQFGGSWYGLTATGKAIKRDGASQT
jgi:predicted lipoprotein with Yx(FWY)xxD motif